MNKVSNMIRGTKLSANQLLITTCIYITLVLNFPFLQKAAHAIIGLAQYNVLFLLSLPLFLFAIVLIIHSVFAWKWLLKPVLMITIIVSACLLYATISYGIVFDYGMVQNTFETDTAEAFSYVNGYATLFVLSFGVLPAGLIAVVEIKYQPFLAEVASRLKLILSSILVIALIASVFYSDYAAVGRNNKPLIGYITPYKMLDATVKYIKHHYLYPPLVFTLLDAAPTIHRTDSKKHVTVMVLGETARAQNFSYNGYSHNTNQYTAHEKLISFSNMHSCGTATAVSVPCMFSRLSHTEYDNRQADAQQNVVDIIAAAGANVLWISNNNGSCKGVCKRVPSIQIIPQESHPLCDGEFCFDEVLLEPLNAKLSTLTHANTLIVLHMIGSHGPTYYKRYPQTQRTFTPDCPRSDIQNCTDEALMNTYDNTIAYTDYVLEKIITSLKRAAIDTEVNTSLIYVSDHGESLGENGIYLHGLPYSFAPESQTHIPMLLWAGKENTDLAIDCIAAVKDTYLSHDNVFDILLGMMAVSTVSYSQQNDPFSPCNLSEIVHNLIPD